MGVPVHAKTWVLTAGLATVSVLPAQWLNYPTAGVTKKPDGSRNLAARLREPGTGSPICQASGRQPDAHP